MPKGTLRVRQGQPYSRRLIGRLGVERPYASVTRHRHKLLLRPAMLFMYAWNSPEVERGGIVTDGRGKERRLDLTSLVGCAGIFSQVAGV
jgi:hypothetical protein